MSNQFASGTCQQGIVGTCIDCGGHMIETLRSIGEQRGKLALECQNCTEEGRIEYILREENPWENPSVQNGVTNTTVKSINWIDCPKCHGHGWVEDPLCDLRRAMNGREHPCPRCHTSGSVPRIIETDGGTDRSVGDIERCEGDDCENRATGVYEITAPPADSTRVNLCWPCAPDVTPVRFLHADTDRTDDPDGDRR